MKNLILLALVIYLIISMIVVFIHRKSVDKKKRGWLNGCLIAGVFCTLLILGSITKLYLLEEQVSTTEYQLIPLNYTTTIEHDIYLGIVVENSDESSPVYTLNWKTEKDDYLKNIFAKDLKIYLTKGANATMTVKEIHYTVFGISLPKQLSKTIYELNLPDGEANCVYMQGAPKGTT